MFKLVALIAAAVAAQGTQSTQSAFARAQAAFASSDFRAAVPLFAQVVKEDPANARAWNMYGISLRRTGAWREATAAHRKAAEFDVARPMAWYQLGLAFAAGQQLDSAFTWLMEAKRSGRVNMTNIGTDPLAPALQPDPRYAALFPTAEEYASPFVEPARILQEWQGEAAGDQFGWIARNIGDVDSDGAADVVTSAPTHGAAGTANTGKVYVYSSRSGRLLWSATGPAGGQLGIGVEAAGDVNGDGVPDVIAGAPFANQAFVYSGLDGKVLLSLRGEAQGDGFGQRVSDVGDLNGDGRAEVLVGAPQHDGAGQNAGRVYVFSGMDGRTLLTLDGDSAGDTFGTSLGGRTRNGQSWIVVGAAAAGARNTGRVYVYRGLEGKPAYTIDADSAAAALGAMFVSVIGDIDGDGTLDAYGSDWAHSARGASTGRIFVHSGRDGRRILTLTGEQAGDGFGIGPADAGDVDRDGFDDLIIGAWQHATAAPSGGRVYLYSGKTGALLRTWTGKVPGETFGFDATGIGDVNGDGHIDFLLTSAWSAIRGVRSGRMFILSGAPAGS
jgi:hypothetical protein